MTSYNEYDQMCGNTQNTADGHEQENMEGEPTALRSDARTVRQLTGEVAALGNDARTVG